MYVLYSSANRRGGQLGSAYLCAWNLDILRIEGHVDCRDGRVEEPRTLLTK